MCSILQSFFKRKHHRATARRQHYIRTGFPSLLTFATARDFASCFIGLSARPYSGRRSSTYLHSRLPRLGCHHQAAAPECASSRSRASLFSSRRPEAYPCGYMHVQACHQPSNPQSNPSSSLATGAQFCCRDDNEQGSLTGIRALCGLSRPVAAFFSVRSVAWRLRSRSRTGFELWSRSGSKCVSDPLGPKLSS